MKKAKKLLSLALSMLLVLPMVACGDNNQPATSGDDGQVITLIAAHVNNEDSSFHYGMTKFKEHLSWAATRPSSLRRSLPIPWMLSSFLPVTSPALCLRWTSWHFPSSTTAWTTGRPAFRAIRSVVSSPTLSTTTAPSICWATTCAVSAAFSAPILSAAWKI